MAYLELWTVSKASQGMTPLKSKPRSPSTYMLIARRIPYVVSIGRYALKGEYNLGNILNMTYKAAVSAFLAFTMASSAVAQAPPTIQRLKIGGGGLISGMSTPPGTGVRLARTDAGGLYVWGGNQYPIWQQLITASSMSSGDFIPNGYGLSIDEIAASNTNASAAYMYYGGYVFYTSNLQNGLPGTGTTWCRDNGNMVQQTLDPANLHNTRFEGPTLAVDPNNNDHVIVGTTVSSTPLSTQGVWETFNGTSCSPTWTQIATTSIPLSGTMGYRVAFDPTATMLCHVGVGTCSTNAYIWTSNGGVYVTNNAGTAWAATTGGPTGNVRRLKVSYATAGGGNVWAIDGAADIWRYSAATWLKMTAPGACCNSIAINPSNGDQVVGLGGSTKLWVTLNANVATPTWNSYSASWAGGDSPWQATMQVLEQAGGQDIDFDPINGGLLAAHAQGYWTTPLPTAAFTWTAQVNGVEELLPTGKAANFSAGGVTIGVQDEGTCHLSTTYNLTNNAAVCGTINTITPLSYASGLSITPDGTATFAKVSSDFNVGFDYSGVSTDGFVSNYLPLNTWNATVAPSAFANSGGLIEATVPSTTGLTTWSAGAGSIICAVSGDLNSQSELPLRCFGATVVDSTHVTLQGSTWGVVGTHNTTLYVPATALISYVGNGTLVNVVNDSGKVKVTTLAALVASGYPVCITGATMTTTTVVNGCWIVQNLSGKSFDLGPSSSFATGDSYVTGGVVSTWGAPGGGIAAASTSNWTMYGADSTFPMCTANGGASYSEVDAPAGPLPLTTVTGGPYAAGASVFTVVNGATLVSPRAINIQLASGRAISTTQYTVATNTVTLTAFVVPPGDSIVTGAVVYGSTGWPISAGYYATEIAADQVTANTFYGVNTDYGLLKWTNCGAPTLVTNTTGFSGSTVHGTLRVVPGQAGHLFYVAGPQGSGNAEYVVGSATKLQRTCNGVNNTTGSVTWATVPGFFTPHTVGFGKVAPNETYPSIIVAGWYDAGNVEANAVYGIWRSIDDGSNGSVTSCTNGTWKNLAPGGISTFIQGWSVAPIRDAIGDQFIYGLYYVLGADGAWLINVQ